MTEHRFDTWTTVLRNPFGLEIHNAWFVPRGWPGHGPVVNLGIPECELQVTFISREGEPVICNAHGLAAPQDVEPRTSRSTRYVSLRSADKADDAPSQRAARGEG